jgi:class 3 adenylate cyclase
VCVVLGSLVLGLLTASMLVERQNHRNLLYKIMPQKAIAKLSRGQTVAESFNIVTIFFCDIVGYTSMVGGMSPRQVMKMLNELYMELDILVAKHRVYKVETIGDAYMVVGGAPERVIAPLAAQRVALFAIDAIDLVRTFRTRDGEQLFIRAGLASGPAIAGVVGKAMPRYCFFGDTVNFASRMESTSKKMRVQCADITCRLLRDAPDVDFHLTKRTEGDIVGVDVKGKGRLVT